MRLTIITPTWNSMPTLRSCVASVRGQVSDGAGFTVAHHVQDGLSTERTREFLAEAVAAGRDLAGYRLSAVTEADAGMYDALNRAFAATDGEIVGHLNSDEQYLPGTLEFVDGFFRDHPAIDVLFGAVVVVDSEGGYICSRMPLLPHRLHTQVCHLCTLTATTFYRRSAIESLGVYFDTSFKTAGDADLVLRMLKADLTMATTRRYLAVFMDSGDNLALSTGAKAEQQRLREMAPGWAKRGYRLVEMHHRLRKLVHGAYTLRPFRYPFIRVDGEVEYHDVPNPSGRWLSRLKP